MVTGVPFERDRRVRRPRVSRALRHPVHRFNLVTKPYQIQPFMIAPVLAGETLNFALLQSQIWSDPLASGMKNIGWWCENFLFYVKHTDLVGWDTDGQIGHEMVDMMTLDASLAGFQDADGNDWTYCYPGAVDYVLEATKACVGAYFREEGESWNTYTLDNVPIAAIYGSAQSDWTDKLTLDANYQDRSVSMPGDVGQLEDAMVHWMALRDAGLVTMNYDDWMRASGSPGSVVGGSTDSPTYHRPELIFSDRQWSYPINTVEPTTGVPATAAGWRVAAEAKKKFAFPQPGWIVGFSLVRPKVYLGTQQGAVAGAMQSRLSWLPPQINQHHDLGHIQFDATHGPLATVMTSAYWIDLRDLLDFGDQFINYVTPASGNSGVPFMALPTVGAQRRYASSTQIMALFSDTVNGRFRQDGVCNLSIAGVNKGPPGQLLTLGHSTS